MNRDEILAASRKENQNKDLPELAATYQAGNIAGRVGATVCCLLSLLAYTITDTLLYSPWIIYCSILGTHWLVKYTHFKRKTDLIVSVMLLLLSVIGLIFFVLRLLGRSV